MEIVAWIVGAFVFFAFGYWMRGWLEKHRL